MVIEVITGIFRGFLWTSIMMRISVTIMTKLLAIAAVSVVKPQVRIQRTTSSSSEHSLNVSTLGPSVARTSFAKWDIAFVCRNSRRLE